MMQTDLFETCAMQELVDAALDGYSVTIFAFGQVGGRESSGQEACTLQGL